ncbi:hypothetical protein CHCC14821_4312 [Bacillus paralicheniformis]|nr:hypothetical protein CHCC14821_4312 [Bacillus paralicheniformis]
MHSIQTKNQNLAMRKSFLNKPLKDCKTYPPLVTVSVYYINSTLIQ